MRTLRAEHRHRDPRTARRAGLGKTFAPFLSLRKYSLPDGGPTEKTTFTLSCQAWGKDRELELVFPGSPLPSRRDGLPEGHAEPLHTHRTGEPGCRCGDGSG